MQNIIKDKRGNLGGTKGDNMEVGNRGRDCSLAAEGLWGALYVLFWRGRGGARSGEKDWKSTAVICRAKEFS